MSDNERYELSAWQKMRMETVHAGRSDYGRGIAEVTVLAYHFCEASTYDQTFMRIECAIRETWLHCGQMKTVVVTNCAGASLQRFAREFPAVEIQIEPSLVPGKIKTMSIDCISKLHTRFTTPYVLIVQNDGFPVRGGLEQFVGKYDYIGAPWVRHTTYYDLYPHDYGVGNGGFSLRSKRLCEAAADYYRKYFKYWPYWWYILGDDTFYCKTLRFWFPAFRSRFVWADCKPAAEFSIEHNAMYLNSGICPFGFHGEAGWKLLEGCSSTAYLHRRNSGKERQMAMNARPLIVSAIRDEAMYMRSIAQNHDCDNCDKFAIDNRERNESIPVLYNRAIEQTLANEVDHWIVFAHEDFEPLEPLDEVLQQADPQQIYGIIGGRLLPRKRWLLGGIWSGVFYGEIMQTEKDGTNKITVGNRTPSGTVVETVDCQFIAVHTLLLRRLPLRFDENLTFDLYAEDFCLAAWVRHNVKSAILNLQACHHSSGNIAPRFFDQKQYLDRKYPKHEAFSVVGYTIGGGRTVMRRMQKKVRSWIDRHAPRLLKWYFRFVD